MVFTGACCANTKPPSARICWCTCENTTRGLTTLLITTIRNPHRSGSVRYDPPKVSEPFCKKKCVDKMMAQLARGKPENSGGLCKKGRKKTPLVSHQNFTLSAVLMQPVSLQGSLQKTFARTFAARTQIAGKQLLRGP